MIAADRAAPVLEHGHDPPIGELLSSVGLAAYVLRARTSCEPHQLGGADLDPMLSPVQWAAIEDCSSRDITVRRGHLADTATPSNGIARVSPVGQLDPVQGRRGVPSPRSGAVGASQDLHVVAGGVFEVEASSMVIDDVRPGVAGIGPVRQSPIGDPGKDGVEVLLTDEERVVDRLDRSITIGIIQADTVCRLHAQERPKWCRGRSPRMSARKVADATLSCAGMMVWLSCTAMRPPSSTALSIRPSEPDRHWKSVWRNATGPAHSGRLPNRPDIDEADLIRCVIPLRQCKNW